MEGFFRPGEIEVPFDLRRATRALVRLHTPIYFCGIFTGDEPEAARLRLSFERRRFWLPEGAVLWQVVLSRDTVSQLRQDAAAGKGNVMTPGIFELLRALDQYGDESPMVVAQAQGSGAGAFVDSQGTILTCYHVAREEVDAATTPGDIQLPAPLPRRCRYIQAFAAAPPANGDLRCSYDVRIGALELVSHVSPAEWRAGLDAALLRGRLPDPADGKPADPPGHWLEFAPEPPRPGDQLWLLGFPVRSRRRAVTGTGSRYDDADGSLRISTGKLLDWPTEHNFVVDADSFSGNSGGPVLNERGQIAGMVWNVHPSAETERRATEFSGGTICVDAHSARRRLGM